jgi:hypothetical protein
MPFSIHLQRVIFHQLFDTRTPSDAAQAAHAQQQAEADENSARAERDARAKQVNTHDACFA